MVTIIETMMHLGSNIQKIRKLLKETQAKFAQRMGVTLPMQKSYERNKSQPDIIYIEKLELLTGLTGRQLRSDPVNADLLSKKVTKVTSAGHELQSINDELPLGDLKVTLKDHLDLLKEMAARAEREKERLYNIIEKNLSDILVNSNTTLEALSRIQNITVADDAVNMAYLDKAQGLAPGTSASIAGNAEHELNNLTEENDKMENARKIGTHGKAKKH